MDMVQSLSVVKKICNVHKPEMRVEWRGVCSYGVLVFLVVSLIKNINVLFMLTWLFK